MRYEYKFLLDFQQYYSFREELKYSFDADIHSQKLNKYPVFSQYFDNNCFSFFNEKINGEYSHTHIRIRTYSNILFDMA